MPIIDYVEHLNISDEALTKYHSEILMLEYLKDGLSFLNSQIAKTEDKLLLEVTKFAQNPDMKNFQFLKWNNGLVTCAFHWYSVSACNYVQLIGWILHSENPYRAKKYLKSVLPNTIIWRHKIGAHFAMSDTKTDNDANKSASVMNSINYIDGLLKAGSMTITINNKNGQSQSELKPWSLTTLHKELKNRYNW